jgi:AcrR family transcriptional regulator
VARKIPQQQRAKDMVDRILEGGRAVLLRDGHDATSTNRIAAEAGISPGSLYQYFENKETVIAAIVDRYSDDLSERVAASLADRFDESGREMVRATLNALIDALEENAEFLRVVTDDLPRRENRARAEALEDRIGGLMSAYIAARRTNLRRDVTPSTAAWILVRAIENLTVRYVLDQPPIDRGTFVSELEQLVTGYLPELDT